MAKEDTKKQQSIEELQRKLEEAYKEKEDLKAKILEGEEGALRRVAKHLDVNPEEIITKEQTPVDDLIEIDMGSHEVNINGRIYYGKVRIPRLTAGVIHQAIGDKRQRLLKELTGNDYVMQDIGASLRASVVGKVNAYGEKV